MTRKVVNGLVTAVITFFVLFPVFWLVSTSFKQHWEWTARPPVWIPTVPVLENYKVLFTGEMFMHPGGAYGELPEELIRGAAGAEAQTIRYIIAPAYPQLLNSLVIAGIATVIAVFVGYLAAYAISRYRTGGSVIYLLILTTRMFPAFGIAIPLVVVYSGLRAMDNHLTLAAIYAAVSMAFVIWMMKSFMDEVPKEVEEAAMVDGCSTFNIIFRVTLPLVKGGLAAAGLFVFIINWGEFFLALIFTYANAVTAPVQLQKYFATSGYLYGPMAAQSTLAIIPVIVLAYLIQKHLVRGLTFGAVKAR